MHIGRRINRRSGASNEINQFWNTKGIIVDIGFNGGGNIDHQIMLAAGS